MCLMLMNSALTLHLFPHSIVENINEIAQNGIIDYDLYVKIMHEMYQQARRNPKADSPFSKHAKVCM